MSSRITSGLLGKLTLALVFSAFVAGSAFAQPACPRAPDVDVASVRLGASYGAVILGDADAQPCAGFDEAQGCTLIARNVEYRIQRGVVVGIAFSTRREHRLPLGLTGASSREELVARLDSLGVAYEERSDGDYRVISLPCVRAGNGVRHRVAFTFHGGALRLVTEREAA
jgi:hypothetical protein